MQKVKLRKRRSIWNSRFVKYIAEAEFASLDDAYEKIIGQLVKMIDEPQKWLIKNFHHL
jgi:hypothetical protein